MCLIHQWPLTCSYQGPRVKCHLSLAEEINALNEDNQGNFKIDRLECLKKEIKIKKAIYLPT